MHVYTAIMNKLKRVHYCTYTRMNHGITDLYYNYPHIPPWCRGKSIVVKIRQFCCYWGHIKRIWYLPPMRAAKVQASLRICAVSPEPPLLAHTSSESRGTFRQKARSLAPLNGWACTVKICHDGLLEDTNSLDAPHCIIAIYIGWHKNMNR